MIKDYWNSFISNLSRAHKSITLWFNSIIGTLLMAIPFAQENFPALQQYISPDFYKHAMVALIVGNMILRFKTTRALADK